MRTELQNLIFESTDICRTMMVMGMKAETIQSALIAGFIGNGFDKETAEAMGATITGKALEGFTFSESRKEAVREIILSESNRIAA